MEETQGFNRFHRVADRSYGGGLFGTISMLYKTVYDGRQIRDVHERPPFPIIIERPTFGDILRNMKTCDLVAFGAMYAVGVGAGFCLGRRFTYTRDKFMVLNFFTQIFMVGGAAWAFRASYSRLTGYWDNGLRWNVPIQQITKFDTSSEFEKKTIFKNFRIRD